MPRHEFRTIEAFVQRLEAQRAACLRQVERNDTQREKSFWSGKADSFSEVLDILRSSNIGIVYPPAEQGDKS